MSSSCFVVMRSLNHHGRLSSLGISRPQKRFSFVPISSFRFSCLSFHSLKFNGYNVRKSGYRLGRTRFQVWGIDEDSFGISTLDDLGDKEVATGYLVSSSDGEDSDGEFTLNSLGDIDLPAAAVSTNDALTITAHRLGMIGRGHKKYRIKLGLLLNVGLITFLVALILFVDYCAWKIVRLPLDAFYLSRPFFISAALVSIVGYLCVPFLNDFKIHQIVKKVGPVRHSRKRATPTMGGLLFVPIGVGIAKFIAGFYSVEISGVALATLAFAAIGLLHDIFLVKNHNGGLPRWIKIILELAVGAWFSFWLDNTNISSPYSMKMLIPLPEPLGLVYLGKCYLLLASFSFVFMGNGVELTDGLDGLAGGTAALAFIGMSIAVLPICSELAIFGASMAGACVGFLLHNRYRASVFMGNTGSLALGGALASMAACTGMFYALFISSGVFLLEASTVVMQVLYFKATKYLNGTGRQLFLLAPFHYHLILCGFREPIVVAGAYIISGLLALFAGYVGLISA